MKSYPVPTHPLGNLTFQGGDLWEVYHGPPQQGPPQQRTRYMTAPAISIIEKQGMRNLGNNRCSYTFRLSAPPDQTWTLLLGANFREVHVVPSSKTIVLDCAATDLAQRYEDLKSAVAKTNADYQAERAQLIAQVQTQDQANAKAVREEAEARRAAKEGFDSLKL